MSDPTERFRLDPRLLTPKLEPLAREMNERILATEKRIRFEVKQNGNMAGYFPRLFDSYEQLADERIKRLYDGHCEVWKDQNQSVTPAFIRAFRDRIAIPEIRLRKSAVISEVTEPRTKQWQNPHAMSLREWNRRMDKLVAKWNGILEADALKLEYRATQRPREQDRVALQALPSPTIREGLDQTQSDATAWRSFRSEFKALASEELILDPGNRRDRWLRAFVDYKYVKCDFGTWHISSGPNEDCRASFETLATRAGVSLGSPQGADPLEFWLHYLFLDLLKHKSDQLFAAKENEGGIILRVCEASATYCARLEKEALEKSSHESVPRPRARVADSSPTAKLADAIKFPTMTVPEVMAVVHLSRASVYRFLNEGRLDRPGLNKKPGKRSKTLILTSSVQRMLRPQEE
jgi:hypothetical protein